jgi:hypothetical protein
VDQVQAEDPTRSLRLYQTAKSGTESMGVCWEKGKLIGIYSGRFGNVGEAGKWVWVGESESE